MASFASSYLVLLLCSLLPGLCWGNAQVPPPGAAPDRVPPATTQSALATQSPASQDEEPPPRGWQRAGQPQSALSDASVDSTADAFGSVDEM